MFTCVDAAMLRASVIAPHPVPRPAPSGDSRIDTDNAIAWLSTVWSDNEWAQAITAASPVLARRVQDIVTGACTFPRRVDRAATAVLKYTLRAYRATPFGLFAGVAPVDMADACSVTADAGSAVFARMDWRRLDPIITTLEASHDLLLRLSVVRNSGLQMRDGRVELAHHVSAEAEPGQLSVRSTTALAMILHHARRPVPVMDIVEELAREYPRTTVATILGAVGQLVEHGILVTSLRAPTSVVDAVGHLLRELDAVDAGDIPEIRATVSGVRDLAAVLDDHNASPQDPRRAQRRARATACVDELYPADSPALAIDTRLGYRVSLSAPVLEAVASAAEVLTRLSAHPTGKRAWQEWRYRFVERYGTGAAVPVDLVTDPTTGLGFPAGYPSSIAPIYPDESTDRDRELAALAQGAVIDNTDEVDIQGLLSHLTHCKTPHPPSHMELLVQIHAASTDAINAGDFEVAITGAARAAGTTTGRFLHLLPPRDRESLTNALAGLPAHAGTATVQVSAPPRHVSTRNVGHDGVVTPDVINLGQYPSPRTGQTVEVGDIGVIADDADTLRLIRLSTGESFEAVLVNGVSYARLHPVARFLCEIGRAGSAVVNNVIWGPNHALLPFLPRLRYGRTILSPAIWRLNARDLPTRGADHDQWRRGLDKERTRLRLPDRIQLNDGDQTLPLDLNDHWHTSLLRRHIDRTGSAALTEPPGDGAFDWIGGRAHQIAVPLAAGADGQGGLRLTPPDGEVRADLIHVCGNVTPHLPGREWLYVKVFAHPDQHEALLAHLSAPGGLFDAGWWFIRYLDPEPHLRLRIPIPDRSVYRDAVDRVTDWVLQMRGRNLAGHMTIDTYVPEVGRYGADECLDAAHEVFAADSAAALAEIRHGQTSTVPDRQVLVAASLIDMACAFTRDVDEGTRWLIDHFPHKGTPVDRDLYRTATRLIDPPQWTALEGAGCENVTIAWRSRAEALRRG